MKGDSDTLSSGLFKFGAMVGLRCPKLLWAYAQEPVRVARGTAIHACVLRR